MSSPQQMRCGGCGHDKFKLFDPKEDTRGVHAHTYIRVQCDGCGAISEIRPFTPLLTIEPTDFGKGNGTPVAF